MHIGRELPQFRLGALFADRQALREEKKNGSQRRKAAKASGRQARGKEWLDFFAPLRLCERKETRDKRRDARNEKQEKRAKKLDPFAVRFLCVFAPLREKRKKSRACRRQVFRTSYF